MMMIDRYVATPVRAENEGGRKEEREGEGGREGREGGRAAV